MRDETRLEDLARQREAFVGRLGQARQGIRPMIAVRQMEGALAALDDLIRREQAKEV